MLKLKLSCDCQQVVLGYTHQEYVISDYIQSYVPPNIKHKSTTQELGVKLMQARDFKKTYMEIIIEEESMNNDHLVSNNNLWVSRLKGAPKVSKLKPPSS